MVVRFLRTGPAVRRHGPSRRRTGGAAPGPRRRGRRRRPHQPGRCRPGPRRLPPGVLRHERGGLVPRSGGHGRLRGPGCRWARAPRVDLADDRVADDTGRARTSRATRLHFLAEQVLAGPGSGGARPADDLPRESFVDRALRPVGGRASAAQPPSRTGRTSPVGAVDVARWSRPLLEILHRHRPDVQTDRAHCAGHGRPRRGVLTRPRSPITHVDVPFDDWAAEVPDRPAAARRAAPADDGPLHGQNRYDRATDTVEAITGSRRSPSRFVAEQPIST